MSDLKINPYLKSLWKWWWVVGVVTLIATGTGYGVSLIEKRVYRATTTLMSGESNTSPQVTNDQWVLEQRLAAGYVAMAQRQPIVEGAVKTLGLQVDWRQVQANMTAVPIPSTSLIEIRVADTDPQRAAALANELARQLILSSSTQNDLADLEQRRAFTQTQMAALQANIDSAESSIKQDQQSLDKETSARSVMELQDRIKAQQAKIAEWRAEYTKLLNAMPIKSAATLSIIEAASAPSAPVSPNVLFNVLLAALGGLVLSVGTIALLEYLRAGRVQSVSEVAELISGVALGSVMDVGKAAIARAHGLIAVGNTDSAAAEAFRVLRTNVRFAWAGPEPIVLLVTSPTVGEGKSTISLNLAASFAQSGKRTIIVDADLRYPSLDRVLGLTEYVGDGLASLLRARDSGRDELATALAYVVLDTKVPGLWLVPAGQCPDQNPGELLASPRMGEILEELCSSADVVIVDSPPVLPVADAAILGSLPMGVILVAEAGRTTPAALSQARGALIRADARILGFVFNRAQKSPAYEYRPARGRRSPLRLLRRA